MRKGRALGQAWRACWPSQTQELGRHKPTLTQEWDRHQVQEQTTCQLTQEQGQEQKGFLGSKDERDTG